MRPLAFAAGFLAVLSAATENLTQGGISKQILPSTFKPPQVFVNDRAVRSINLQKGYARETINLVVKNIDAESQTKYYLPFEEDVVSRVGGFEVKDKNDIDGAPYKVQLAQFDTESSTHYYLIELPEPLKPKSEITLSISYNTLSALTALPATVEQTEKQFVSYTFSAFIPSAYKTSNQKTKLKVGSSTIPDFTKLPKTTSKKKEDPEVAGDTLTYGPYDDVPAGAEEFVSVRYEFTKPLMRGTLLERDIEISHWGGNIAIEERHWLTNRAAKLKNQFSRVSWQMTQYARPPSHALRDMQIPLQSGSLNPYYTDDIGNVSTSKWRPMGRDAGLELKPRYPIFGGWNYSFRVGWDADLKWFLRKLQTGESYVLKVPFLEGLKIMEGIEYGRVDVRVILPEGATEIKFDTSVPLTSSEILLHKTFMDTIGRPTLRLSAINLADNWRERDLIVTYEYAWTAGLRKPISIIALSLGIFVTAWVVGNLDVSISASKSKKS